jgi:hypothetical protein
VSEAATAPEDTAGPDEQAVRTWTITTTSGCTVTGHLPGWATADPSEEGVSADRLAVALDDVNHHAPFEGLSLSVFTPGRPVDGPEAAPFFRGGIDCNPFAAAPEPCVPVANIEVLPDFWLNDLDPDGLAGAAAMLRTLADRLDNELRPALVAARADWAAAALAA